MDTKIIFLVMRIILLGFFSVVTSGNKVICNHNIIYFFTFQRKDYSALTKYLPPKHEYVVAVRLANVQCDLYSKYLEMGGYGGAEMVKSKGAKLFSDYQALMRIWTHPWVLKMNEIRNELKVCCILQYCRA